MAITKNESIGTNGNDGGKGEMLMKTISARKMKTPGKFRHGNDSRKKGFVYTLEVLLAVGLIFLTLVYLFRFSEPTPQHDLTIIKRSGIEALEFMDQYHELRKWVSEFNEAKIESTLNTLLPSNIKFESEICTNECSTAGVNTKKSVVAVDYYVTAYRDAYLGQKVRLWLWR